MHIDTDLATLVLAVLGGLIALFQWRRDQSWKRADKLDSLYKEFSADRLIQIACRVMDWNRGNFKFPDGEVFSFTHEDVEKSLAVHGVDPNLTFTSTQARMRDAYDAFLCFLERLDAAISDGLVPRKQALGLFGYWIKHFMSMPEHPGCKERALQYIANYSNLAAFERLHSRAV